MTRCLLRSIITVSGEDSEALYLQNAEVYVFRTGTTTTPVMYAGPTGGSALANPILSDGNGEIEVWLDPAESNIIDIRVDSNGGTAFLANQPSKRQGFTTFTKTLQAGGPQGPQGPQGSNGGGTLIAGGTTAQALVKASGTDYDTTWHTFTAGDVGADAAGAAASEQARAQAEEALAAHRELPAYAGTRSGSFEPSRGIYNGLGKLLAFKSKLGLAMAGTGIVNIGVVGDSTEIGYAVEPKYSWPAVLQQKVLPALGFPSAGESAWCQNPASLVAPDSRMTYVSYAGTNGLADLSEATGQSAQFVSTVAGTVAEFQFLAVTGSVTLTVDGSSPANGNVTITNQANATYSAGVLTFPTTTYNHATVTITGLANTTHTLKAVWASGQVIPERFAVRGTSGVMVDDMGISGWRTVDWIGAPNYLDSFYAPSAFGRTALFDLLITCLGANDADGQSGTYTPTPINTFRSNLQYIANGGTGAGTQADRLIVAEWYNGANPTHASWEPYVSAMYDVADTLNTALLDFSYRYTATPPAGSFADGTHPSRAGAARIATDVAAAIAS